MSLFWKAAAAVLLAVVLGLSLGKQKDIGVLLTILTMIGTGTILHWMKTPDDIYQYSYDYIIVIFGGILTSVLYNSLAAILRAVGDSKSPILFLAISSVLNIILDLVFLVGMQSGVAGAGYATVISQGISGILCLIYLQTRLKFCQFRFKIHITLPPDIHQLLSAATCDNLFMYCILTICFFFDKLL